MSMQILMPALSPTMEEGKLAKWLVKEGDDVHPATCSPRSRPTRRRWSSKPSTKASIGKILVPEGTEGVKVNPPIAELVRDDGEGCADNATAAAPQRKRSLPAARSRCRRGMSTAQSKPATGARRRGPWSASAPANPELPKARSSSP